MPHVGAPSQHDSNGPVFRSWSNQRWPRRLAQKGQARLQVMELLLLAP